MATWVPQPTADGSFTFFSEEFGETFHSTQGAKAEAFQKFVAATRLLELAQGDRLCLLDVCYGLGYNTAAALETIWAVNPRCHVTVRALEIDETVPQAAIAPALLAHWSPAVQPVLQALASDYSIQSPRLDARLLIGDARQTIQTLGGSGFQADAIFFDPFSPRRCPPLWTIEFFTQAARCLAEHGILATYSRSASVRSALQLAGLQIGTIPLGETGHQPHEWSQGTVAGFDAAVLHPLSAMEQEHLHTRAAVPYRDPDLQASAADILARHTQEQQASTLESTSSWRRRWGIR